jgi:hypothetical protein
MAAVLIVLGPVHQPGSNRLQMDVGHQLAEKAIALTENPLVATSKAVADVLLLSVVILALAGEDPLHGPADPIVVHFDRKMNTVRYQPIGVEIAGTLHLPLSEQAGELEVIIAGLGELSPIIPVCDYVIQPTADFDPWFPGHGARTLSPDNANVTEVKPDASF